MAHVDFMGLIHCGKENGGQEGERKGGREGAAIGLNP